MYKTKLNNIKLLILFFIFLTNLFICQGCGQGKGNKDEVFIGINLNSPMQKFGASKIEAALKKLNLNPALADAGNSGSTANIRMEMINSGNDSEIKKEGYRIRKKGNGIVINAIDNSGAMYGLMDVAEQIEMQK